MIISFFHDKNKMYVFVLINENPLWFNTGGKSQDIGK